MQKFFFILLFACIGTSFSVKAQRKIMVYDAETKVPMRKVWVWADTQKCDSTNYLGQTTIPQQFDTLTIIKPKYLPLRIPARMVGDSISMIKDEKMIGEVVVYGKDMQTQLNKTIQGWMKADANERAMLAPPLSVHSISFLCLTSKLRSIESKGNACSTRSNKWTSWTKTRLSKSIRKHKKSNNKRRNNSESVRTKTTQWETASSPLSCELSTH